MDWSWHTFVVLKWVDSGTVLLVAGPFNSDSDQFLFRQIFKIFSTWIAKIETVKKSYNYIIVKNNTGEEPAQKVLRDEYG